MGEHRLAQRLAGQQDQLRAIGPGGERDRVVALSGGYSREDANAMLAKNTGLIASFSRALSEGLSAQQSDAEFNTELGNTIQSIYDASVAG